MRTAIFVCMFLIIEFHADEAAVPNYMLNCITFVPTKLQLIFPGDIFINSLHTTVDNFSASYSS